LLKINFINYKFKNFWTIAYLSGSKKLYMNSKALLTLLAFLLWLLFCNWWWCNNKEECDCDRYNTETTSETPVVATVPTADTIAKKDTVITPSAEGGVVVKDSNDVLIYFPTGSATKEPSKAVDNYLTSLGVRLKASGEKALVVGNTDNNGAADKNIALSIERAIFVKQILVKHGGIDANISTNGVGDKDPIGDNNTDAGRSQNRRVEIKISK
jgi:outer membrane protein OmpA-like peptidoglycan-associated protein